MNCPVCSSELRPVDRGGIEIDVCTRCRGVWLDRGELDKLIDAASGHYAGRRGDDDSDFGDDSEYGRRHGQHPPGVTVNTRRTRRRRGSSATCSTSTEAMG